MMKWGGRKPSSSSSSSSSSHASPFSWLSKFKQMRISSDSSSGKMKHKVVKQNSPSSTASPPQYSGDKFYGGDDGALWRPSFDEEKKSTKDSTFENIIPSSGSDHIATRNDNKTHGRRELATLKLKEKAAAGVEEERKLLNDNGRKVLMKVVEEYDREKEYENIRSRFERKAQQVLKEQLIKLEKEADQNDHVLQQFESPRTICTPRTHSFASCAELKNASLRNIIEDHVFSNTKSIEKTPEKPSQKKLISSSERQNLKQTEELKVKTEKQKRPLQRIRKPKIKIYSPRMVSKVEICRIKALEDMKKAKLKMKKEREEIVEQTTPGLDSFAVIKCSSDPRQDFRDSMIEMIREKQISQPDEMEELLACYLTLNVDEYHDLIIKVFRQVWFDMSQHGLGTKSDMQWDFYE